MEMKEGYIRERFGILTMGRGGLTASEVGPGSPVEYISEEQDSAVDHDEALFVARLTGKQIEDAFEIFKGFQSELRLAELREIDEDDFLSSFN